MAKGKSEIFIGEWYPWYPERALTSEVIDRLTLAEEGAYRRAMDKAWLKGSLPADAQGLADVIGKKCSVKIAERLLEIEHFRPMRGNRNRVVHTVVERVRAEQFEKTEKKIKKSRDAAEKRWNRNSNDVNTNDAQALLVQCQSNANKNRTEQNRIDKNKKATASPSVAADPVETRIWKDGREMLLRSGLTTSSAGSFLGSMAKTYGEEPLAMAIAAAQAKNPANPKSYLVAVLQKRGNASAYVGRSDQVEADHKCPECFDSKTIFQETVPGDWQSIKEMPCPQCASP